MARREPIPPADVLFSSGRRTEGTAPAAPKHVKVTVYMPPDMVADVDETRATLRREGKPADRGRLVRAAIRMAQDNAPRWRSFIEEEN